MKKRYLCMLGISVVLQSCISEVKDVFEQGENLPVLNAIIMEGQPIEARLSLSADLDLVKMDGISDAQISLFKDGVYLEDLFHLKNGFYSSSHVAEARTTYRCEVLIDGYEILSCKDSLPSPIKASIVSFSNQSGLNREGEYFQSLDLSFIDDTTTEDYYEILIFTKYSEQYLPRYGFNEEYNFILNEGLEPYSTQSLLFSDKLLPKRKDTLSINLAILSYSKGCKDGICRYYYNDQTYKLEVRRVSKDYYAFKKSFYFYDKTVYGDFVEGVVTPIPLFSNVENGYGIFASYCKSIDTIFVESEIIIR